MSTATTALTDTLPSTVPKLNPSGANWAVFEVRFRAAVDAKGFWGHFNGTIPYPTVSSPSTSIERALLAQWQKDERSTKSLLTQKIPDSALMLLWNKNTVEERWAVIRKEYTQKGTYAQTDLRTSFLKSKCPDKGNVKEFLDNLRTKKEELAAVGVEISETDYRSTIISSLPFWLSNFASGQLAAAKLYSATKTIDPDALMLLISEEYNHHQARRTRSNRKAKDDTDEAMSAISTNRSGKKRNLPGVCFNCGKAGHWKRDCKEPKMNNSRPKAGTSKGNGSIANAAVESDAESDGVFFVNAENSPCSSADSMPDLQIVSDSEDENSSGPSEGSNDLEDDDWFSEVGDDAECVCDRDWDPDEDPSPAESDGEPFTSIDMDKATDEAVFVSPGDDVKDLPRSEIFDSGTTRHISPYKDAFKNFEDIPPKSFRAANKQSFSAVGMGDMEIDLPNGVDVSTLQLTEVLYSPEVGYTLVSIGRLDEKGFLSKFADGKLVIHGPDGQRVGEVQKAMKGLYRIAHESETMNAAKEEITLQQFHNRMGHISPEVAKQLVTQGFVTSVKLEKSKSNKPFFCKSCVYAKATRKPIQKICEGERASEFGGKVHTDLWGPAPVTTKGGRRYYITFTDNKFRFTNVDFLQCKSKVFEAYKMYEAWVETQTGAKVKILHSDRGGEYLGKAFVAYLKSKGTGQKLTTHDTPQHNGVAERRNRTILECVRALLHASGLPKSLWGEAVRHVVWLMNRTTTRALDGMTPYKAVFKKKPDMREVREWGEKVWVRVEGGNKLGGRVEEGRWVGVDDQSKGVWVYWPKTQTVSVEQNVYYNKTRRSADVLEGEDWQAIEIPADPPSQEIPPNPDKETISKLPSEPEERPKRTRKPTQRVRDILEGRAEASDRPGMSSLPAGVQAPSEPAVLEGEGLSEWMMVAEYALVAEISEAEAIEPRTLAKAKRRPDWPLWEAAMLEEMATLKAAGTWVLFKPPAGANIIGSQWTFRAKKDATGNIVRYKARLVAQGFSQIPGVDYFDTFAPVARLASIRSVLAMSAVMDLELHQLDVKGAYLNGILNDNETIYIRQPPGFVEGNLVCHLKKALYGLKQAGRHWYEQLVEIMMDKLKFSRCEVDQAVFF